MKVIIIGDYGVGKTSFIKRHINGSIAKKFLKESGCHMHPLVFSTSKCSLELQVTLFVYSIRQKDVSTNKLNSRERQVWDTQGQEALGGLKSQFLYASMNIFAIMHNLILAAVKVHHVL